MTALSSPPPTLILIGLRVEDSLTPEEVKQIDRTAKRDRAEQRYDKRKVASEIHASHDHVLAIGRVQPRQREHKAPSSEQIGDIQADVHAEPAQQLELLRLTPRASGDVQGPCGARDSDQRSGNQPGAQ
jgi:hypothetical protein